MTIPSRAEQIRAVMNFLDSDQNEGRSLEEIATSIVDGYLDGLKSGIKKPAQPLRVGMLLKVPGMTKVSRLVWADGDRGWFVSEDSNYGMMASLSSSYWQYCEEYRPKKRVEGPDGKKSLVEMSDEDIVEQWSNPDWKPGDMVSMSQRMFTYAVVAAAPKAVLLEDAKGSLMADSVANLARYYKREVKMKEIEW